LEKKGGKTNWYIFRGDLGPGHIEENILLASRTSLFSRAFEGEKKEEKKEGVVVLKYITGSIPKKGT